MIHFSYPQRHTFRLTINQTYLHSAYLTLHIYFTAPDALDELLRPASHLSPAVSSLSPPNKLNGQPQHQTFTKYVSCNLWSQRFSCSSLIGAPDTSILMLQCWLSGSCAASCPATGWTFGGPGLRPAQPSMRPSARRTKGSLCGHGGQWAATSNNRSGPKQPLARHWMSNKLVY